MKIYDDAGEAVEQIGDGTTVAVIGSGGGLLEPDRLINALADRFRETGQPRGLTLVHSFGQGDRRAGGLDPLAQEGLLKRVIGGHWGMAPKLSRMAENNEIEAYNISLGVMGLLFREIGGNRPGLITKVGLGTFVDPRIEGARMNEHTTEDLIEVIEINGEEYLLYRSFPIDFAFLRGSAADRVGNISLADEATYVDSLALASATRASRGTVLVQVKRFLPPDEPMRPADVRIPGIYVDGIVEHAAQRQTYEAEENPVYAGHERIDLSGRPPMEMSARKSIARRATQLLRSGVVGNVGVGVPEGVGPVLVEEGCSGEIRLTVEHGTIGGTSALGFMFGAIMNYEARVDAPDMIDFYHGGSLDYAFLGFAQADSHGNSNVSRYQGVIQGSGGFVDIAQTAQTVIFCGTFTVGGLELKVGEGKLEIVKEGRARKFLTDVEHITFSGQEGLRNGHRIFFVTERALFQLQPEGMTLLEIAPGVDLQRDVLDLMDFEPVVATDLGLMDAALFRPEPFGLRRSIEANTEAYERAQGADAAVAGR
jgi:propionate CoA-transferase